MKTLKINMVSEIPEDYTGMVEWEATDKKEIYIRNKLYAYNNGQLYWLVCEKQSAIPGNGFYITIVPPKIKFLEKDSCEDANGTKYTKCVGIKQSEIEIPTFIVEANLYENHIFHFNENGDFHNENGPAIIMPNKSEMWFIDGYRVSEEANSKKYILEENLILLSREPYKNSTIIETWKMLGSQGIIEDHVKLDIV